MKIVHLNTTDLKGGAALAMYRLHQTLLKKRQESTILVGQKTENTPLIGQISGYENVIHFNKYVDRYKLRDFLFTSRQTDLFSKPQYISADVVNLNNIHGGYFNLKNLPQLCKEKPVIWTLHDMWSFVGNSAHTFEETWWRNGGNGSPNIIDKLMFEQKKKIYSKCNFKIVVPSRWLGSMVEKSILSNYDLCYIPNAVDTEVIKPLDKENLHKKYEVPSDYKVITFIAHGGIKNKWKGGEYVVEVLKELRKKYKILFLEIGCNEKRIIKGDGYWKIPFVHDRKILNEYLNLSDIFLFTSLAENAPLVLLEAQSAGIPTVTFDVGGSKEIVKHLETGYVSKYKDIEDTITGVISILDTPKIAKKYSKNARKNVLDNFTLEKQAEEYIKLYKRAIDEFI